MEKPLLDCSSTEMSTCLGQSDQLSSLEHTRTRYSSIDTPNKKHERKEKWNSWTGIKNPRDNRHLPDEIQIQTEHVSGSSRNTPGQSLTLYARKESGGQEIEVIDIPSHKSSNATSEGIIDGEFTSSMQVAAEFEQLASGILYGWGEPSTTKSLDFCKRHILRHYNNLLKVIGWRKYRTKLDHVPWYLGLINFIYPIFIFLMITFACAAQLTSCFGRDTSLPPVPIEGSNYSVLNCDDHILTADISSYLLILIAYIGGFYIFRRSESEHLSALTETVFLSFNYVSMNKSRKRPALVLSGFLISGLLWLFLSAGVSILRLFALHLDDTRTIIGWFISNTSHTTDDNIMQKIILKHYEVLHYFFVMGALLGFVFFDLLYIAVTINYCSQCQLLTYYIENLIDKVQNKRYKTLNDACKEIYHVYEFLKVLNGKLSFIMSLIFIVFLTNLINSYQNLRSTSPNDHLNIALGFLNIIQWLLVTAFPVMLATLFTAAGRGLRRVSIQIASRPFVYSEKCTSDLELHFFLNFAESTRYSARIIFIPMYPSLVLGFVFVTLLLLTVGLIIPRVQSVSWF